ncbi:MAG: peptidylprolyl isomerase [Chloroflexi bacterium]|nr:peptidylprolyl isomerase [Chloroflexota bacterium]
MNKRPLQILFLLLAVALVLAACNAAPADAPAENAAPTEQVADSESADAPQPDKADETPPTEFMSWPEPPAMSIDPNKIYIATIKTERGDIVVELYADKAPQTVNNFIFLAEQGFYDNTTFHRVINDFMAQAGDPTGTGTGGPGYTFPDEIDPDLSFDRPGLLAMANAGPDTNGSQFFITFAPTPWLDGRHTIFGEVIEGMEVLDKLTRRDPESGADNPGDAIYTIEISEAETSRRPTPTPKPTPFAPDPTADDHFMAAMAPEERVGYWNTPPENILEPGTIYLATFRTEVGDMVVELTPDLAPNNVNNFIALARAGYYDGTHFWQVIEDLVAVGGDPLENGDGNPGYFVDDELTTAAFDDAGWLGSAQSAPNRNGGQFFFTLGPAPWLAERFTPLGRVIEGLEVLSQIEIRDPAQNPESPGTLLQSVDISTAETSRLPTPTPPPPPLAPTMPPEGERPLSDLEPEARNGYYNTAPEMEIDPNKDYVAIIRTEVGDITVDLYEDKTPITVNNFVLLALNGFYDGVTFHRVIEGFMAQSGDPTGSGAGGPGYMFEDEIIPELRHDRAGILSMANAGPNTNGSQFFITFAPAPWLDSNHTIFGEVIEGMDVLEKIELRDPQTATEPGTTIERIDIEVK